MMKPVVRITNRPVDVAAVLSHVRSNEAGGTAVFLGTVRNESGGRRIRKMVIESAKDLAVRDLSRIAREAMKKYRPVRIAVVHRTGELRVGDVIIAIAVSAPHRKDAFKACSYIIDELKKTTPLWKKEIGPGVERWVH